MGTMVTRHLADCRGWSDVANGNFEREKTDVLSLERVKNHLYRVLLLKKTTKALGLKGIEKYITREADAGWVMSYFCFNLLCPIHSRLALDGNFTGTTSSMGELKVLILII